MVSLIFSFELEISGIVQRIHQNSEKWWLLLSENDFEGVLATFFCYDQGVKASQAVQKIAKDQKECRKCPSCVIIC